MLVADVVVGHFGIEGADSISFKGKPSKSSETAAQWC
jgi:hypothetical protein